MEKNFIKNFSQQKIFFKKFFVLMLFSLLFIPKAFAITYNTPIGVMDNFVIPAVVNNIPDNTYYLNSIISGLVIKNPNSNYVNIIASLDSYLPENTQLCILPLSENSQVQTDFEVSAPAFTGVIENLGASNNSYLVSSALTNEYCFHNVLDALDYNYFNYRLFSLPTASDTSYFIYARNISSYAPLLDLDFIIRDNTDLLETMSYSLFVSVSTSTDFIYNAVPTQQYNIPNTYVPFIFKTPFSVNSTNISAYWTQSYLSQNSLNTIDIAPTLNSSSTLPTYFGPISPFENPNSSDFFNFYSSSTLPISATTTLNYQIEYKECSATQIGNCIYNAFLGVYGALFIPKYWNYSEIVQNSGITEKVPFSVVSSFQKLKQEIDAIDTGLIFTEINYQDVIVIKPVCQYDFFSPYCSTFYSVFKFLLYSAFMIYLYRKLEYFF